jgi:uncharacterized membrane protein
MSGTLGDLALAMALFVGSHFAFSSPPVRRPLVAVIGEKLFLGLYSVVALTLITWVVIAYQQAPAITVWSPPTATKHLALTIMPVACVLVVAGASTANPTVVAADGRTIAAAGPVGILKVTRHPVMWGFGLWGIAHLLANGTAAAMLLFGGMTVLALGGALAIDAKKRTAFGECWDAYCAATSYLPFAAMIGGRTRLKLAEIGYVRIAGGLILYGLLLALHPWLFGVSPMPL